MFGEIYWKKQMPCNNRKTPDYVGKRCLIETGHKITKKNVFVIENGVFPEKKSKKNLCHFGVILNSYI